MMKKMLVTLLLMGAVNALALDNFVEGYDFTVATGLVQGATLNDLVTQGRLSRWGATSTNNFYLFRPDYFYIGTNTGAGYTNYYMDIKAGSLPTSLLAGGGNLPDLNGNNVWGGTNTFNGTLLTPSNDMAVSFMGYPKVALSTGMVSIVGVAEGTFQITIPGIAMTIDSNFATVSETQLVTEAVSASVYAIFDLGKVYTGYLVGDMKTIHSSGSVSAFGLVYGLYGNTELKTWECDGGSGGQLHHNNTSLQTNAIVIPFTGRYVGYGGGNGSGDNASWACREFIVYGTTNDYRNFTSPY